MAFDNSGAIAAGTAGGTVLNSAILGGNLRVASAIFSYASDAEATYTAPIVLPKGAVVHYGILCATTSSGSTTISIGISGTAAKYRAAAAFTATDTPTFFGKAAALGVELTADETITITTAAAAAPSSGDLVITFVYSLPN